MESLLAENGVMMSEWIDDKTMWEVASVTYAKQVSGEVRAVIGKNVRPTSIWLTKELPALQVNLNVTKITIIDPETLVETVIFTR